MKLRLIEIGADGAPARCPGYTPPSARDAIEGTVNLYEAVGFEPPWVGYLADWDGDVVGTCAFKSPPQDGVVEIALQTFAGFEGRGVAQEMTRQLVQRAHAADPGLTVLAQTLPRESASGAILRKLGFALDGEVTQPDDGAVWQWRLSPDTAA
ncbi:GNAT family N-acetyltransferase [Panacagrimonas sp.]|uniref:GNAT family N-acetyltransferase n=1 Tax=Panacagrimonas sp. TaxID=2480088 RepID=UPI003B52E480